MWELENSFGKKQIFPLWSVSWSFFTCFICSMTEKLYILSNERFYLRIIAYRIKAELIRLPFKFLDNLTPSHLLKTPYVQWQRASVQIQELVWPLKGRRLFLLGTQGGQVGATSKEETHRQKLSPRGKGPWLGEHREPSPGKGNFLCKEEQLHQCSGLGSSFHILWWP